MLAFCTVLGSAAGGALAQTFPSRAITMIVPFAAGGPGDTRARILAEHMRGTLGQPVVVENVTGAGGSIGVGRVAQAPGDGYTLSVGNWSTHVVNPVVYSLKYDVVKDFEPVGMVTTQPLLILANSAVPANNLSELIAWLKANPGKATMGNSGIGSASYVSGLLFQKSTGTRFNLVPYRGSVQSMQDLISGQTRHDVRPAHQCAAACAGGQDQSIRRHRSHAARRRAGHSDDGRSRSVPGMHVSVWGGLWAGKGTPKPVIAKAQRRRDGGAGRSCGAPADARYRLRSAAARAADARGACGLPACRDREVVAHPQGGGRHGEVRTTAMAGRRPAPARRTR